MYCDVLLISILYFLCHNSTHRMHVETNEDKLQQKYGSLYPLELLKMEVNLAESGIVSNN